MALAILIVLNIPVFLLIGWLAFDSAAGAADTFWETIVALLKQLFVPAIVRVMFGMETTGALGLFPILGFLIACIALVIGEVWLLKTWLDWNVLRN